MVYAILLVLFLPFIMHLVLTRVCGLFRDEFSRQKGAALGFLLGFFVLAIVFGIGFRRELVYLVLIYVFAAYIYFHLFNLSETSRRIRILTAIYKGTGEGENEILPPMKNRGQNDGAALCHSEATGPCHSESRRNVGAKNLNQNDKGKYNCSDMISNRLKRLVNLKQLRVSEGRYFLQGKLLLFAGRMLFAFRRVIFPGQVNEYSTSEVVNHLGGGIFGYCRRRFFGYPLVCLIYILVNLPFLFSSDLPIWDSWSYHFPAFKYIAETIAKGHFPQWFPVSGGIRIGLFHINLFPFLAHRIIGYLLYSFLPISAVFAYKLQFILGVLIMGFGWWLVLKKITGCCYSSFVGTLMVVMAGTGMTFHQEQVLATTYLIPWFVLALLKFRENSLSILPALMLLGMGLSTHYPHIQLISMGLFGVWVGLRKCPVLAPASLRSSGHFISNCHSEAQPKNLKVGEILPPIKYIGVRMTGWPFVILRRNRRILIIMILFLLALLPCFYLGANLKTVVSPLRAGQSGDIKPQSYEDYLGLNYNQISSAKPEYFQQYVKPVVKWDADDMVQAVDRCSFFVGRIGIVLAVIGIFFKLKQGLAVVFLLIIFSALTLGINSPVPIPKYLFLLHFPFLCIFRQWLHFFPMVNFCLSILAAMGLSFMRERIKMRGLSILIIFILSLQILDLAVYCRRYTSVFVFREKLPPRISDYLFHPDNFADGYFLPSSLLQYKDRAELYFSNPQLIPVHPFYVGAGLCARPDKCKLENNGLSIDITTAQPGLLVTPLNYALGLNALVNDKPVKVERVHNALAGVLLEKGEQKIRLNLITDPYLFIVISQLVIYMLCICVIFSYSVWIILK